MFHRLPPFNSTTKNTTSSLDILLETSYGSTLQIPPRQGYNNRYSLTLRFLLQTLTPLH